MARVSRHRAAPDRRHALPEDAIYDILLRLPAKDLCRLRTVCRPWRSLLSDPAFAAAHAAHHPEPLIVVAAGYAKHFTSKEDGVLFDIMDLSGHVVRRVRQVSNARHDNDDEQMVSVKSAQGDLVCLVNRTHGSCRLLDLATGSVHILPEELAEEHAIHAASRTSDHCNIDFAFGQVAATGEHKVLRVLDYFFPYSLMLCEVFSINGGGAHGRWRARAAPPDNVELSVWNSVTINGIVYFLSTEFVEGQDFMPDTVAPLNLESEEWMPTIRGPLYSLEEAAEEDDGLPKRLSLAVLNGYLVLARHIVSSSMDLWFLIDAEKGLWVKQQSIQLNFNCWQDDHRVYPLVVLNDGRVVLVCMGDKGLLKICDPRIGIYTDVAEIGPCDAVRLYTGNLLSLANHPGQ